MRLKIIEAGEPALRSRARALTLNRLPAPNRAFDRTHERNDARRSWRRRPPRQVGLSLQLVVIEDRSKDPELDSREDLAAERKEAVRFTLIDQTANHSIPLIERSSFQGRLSRPGCRRGSEGPRRACGMSGRARPTRTIEVLGRYARIFKRIASLQGNLISIACTAERFLHSRYSSRFSEGQKLPDTERSQVMGARETPAADLAVCLR